MKCNYREINMLNWVEHMGELGLLARSISKILRTRKELKCSPFFSDT